MNTQKHITGYGLQYWLYAVLNKEFGKSVTFIRDSLHSRYSVNRHGFEIESDSISLDKIQSFLVEKLKSCNYIAPPNNHGVKGLMKTTERLLGTEQLYVDVQKSRNIDNTISLNISVFAYWHKKHSK